MASHLSGVSLCRACHVYPSVLPPPPTIPFALGGGGGLWFHRPCRQSPHPQPKRKGRTCHATHAKRAWSVSSNQQPVGSDARAACLERHLVEQGRWRPPTASRLTGSAWQSYAGGRQRTSALREHSAQQVVATESSVGCLRGAPLPVHARTRPRPSGHQTEAVRAPKHAEPRRAAPVHTPEGHRAGCGAACSV